MRIAVCDDCMEDAMLLKRLLGGHEVRVYADAGSFLADIENGQNQYDLYLIDIYLKESISGLELAGRLRRVHNEAVICFISSSSEFYREAYDLYAVQYLLKPVKEADVKQLLERVSANMNRDRKQKLFFQSRGQTKAVSYGKVLYISSREHTLSICCMDGTVHEYKGKLNELASQICGETFQRCHQSFVVNMYHVDNLKGNELMVYGNRIPVSRRYYKEVKRRYQEILFEEVD